MVLADPVPDLSVQGGLSTCSECCSLGAFGPVGGLPVPTGACKSADEEAAPDDGRSTFANTSDEEPEVFLEGESPMWTAALTSAGAVDAAVAPKALAVVVVEEVFAVGGGADAVVGKVASSTASGGAGRPCTPRGTDVVGGGIVAAADSASSGGVGGTTAAATAASAVAILVRTCSPCKSPRRVSAPASAREGARVAFQKLSGPIIEPRARGSSASSCHVSLTPPPTTTQTNGHRLSFTSPSTLQHRLSFKLAINVDVVSRDTARSSNSNGRGSVFSNEISNRYELHEALGQGSTGVVYAARRISDGRRVACKVMRVNDEELLLFAKSEFELQRSIEHPHVVQALDYFTNSQGAVIVLEYFPGRTLSEVVLASPQGRLSERDSCRLFAGALSAIDHLHGKGIQHRDIKAENILVTANLLDLALIDFNTAERELEGGTLTMAGTADYMPPEVLCGTEQIAVGDIWALGLCLHLMLSGTLPFERNAFCSHDQFGQELKRHFPKEAPLTGARWRDLLLSAPCLEVLRQCLQVDYQKRPSAAAVLQMPWVRAALPLEPAGRSKLVFAAFAAFAPPIRRSTTGEAAESGGRLSRSSFASAPAEPENGGGLLRPQGAGFSSLWERRSTNSNAAPDRSSVSSHANGPEGTSEVSGISNEALWESVGEFPGQRLHSDNEDGGDDDDDVPVAVIPRWASDPNICDAGSRLL